MAEVSDKTTNSITVRVKAVGKKDLTYSFYIQKEGQDFSLGQKLENQVSGEEVFLTAEKLSNYTYYDWYVVVSEGDEESHFLANEQVRTYCPSGLVECNGPFQIVLNVRHVLGKGGETKACEALKGKHAGGNVTYSMSTSNTSKINCSLCHTRMEDNVMIPRLDLKCIGCGKIVRNVYICPTSCYKRDSRSLSNISS